jgi:hypothetical protein
MRKTLASALRKLAGLLDPLPPAPPPTTQGGGGPGEEK